MTISALRYEVALSAEQGHREYQEDAIAARFSSRRDIGYVVVADGMGGHEAGDVASRLVASSWSSVIDRRISETEATESTLADTLPLAAMEANAAIAAYINDKQVSPDMGSTLLGTVFYENRFYWISIGDSPLYLFRDGQLIQLNEDHSMGPDIDRLVIEGVLKPEEARHHPDRNCLTSALMGAGISKVDCPEDPREVLPGDILLIASDGLQHLEPQEIETVLKKHQNESCQDILDQIMLAIRDANVPDQDNTSVAVVALKPPANAAYAPHTSNQ